MSIRKSIRLSRRCWSGLCAAGVVVVLAADGLAVGEIMVWGDNTYQQCEVPDPNTDFAAVAAGYYHSLGLLTDGSIVAWGDNSRGECDVPSSNEDFVAIAAKGYHSLGLRADGSLAAWGDNDVDQCKIPLPNADFAMIAAGGYHSLALKEDGTLLAWGRNDFDQCDVPNTDEEFLALAAGYYHSLGLTAVGSVFAWGQNTYGQCNVPAPNSGFVAIAAGGYFSVGLKADGSVVAWGGNAFGQCQVPAPNSGFVAVTAGAYHCVGTKASGQMVAWGRNTEGQCDVPLAAVGLTILAAGGYHSLGGEPAPFTVVFDDVPEDQGGELSVTWAGHWSDAVSAPYPVTTYEIQRQADTWITIATEAATDADAYTVQIATPDVYTEGQPAPFSVYRLVARTAEPSVFFESETQSAYSLDNLAPPPPAAQLLEYPDVVVVTWILPEIPDFREACVFRGTTPDFVPDEPLGCSEAVGYVDELNVMVYYRVQFSDVHGNLSEFSDLVAPTTTAVGGEPGAAGLHLLPCRPNPFNPRTMIAFSLPAAGQVTARICDARGVEVARLADEVLGAGRHTREWNGTDRSGRILPSGTYFCRLETPWGTEIGKMVLLK